MKFLLAFAFIPTVFSAFYVSNDKVMSEVQTYVKGQKKIVLIDMVHIGPKSFYRGVKSTLKKYRKENSIILQEGVRHCDKKGDEIIIPTAKANFEELERLFTIRESLSTSDALKKLKEAGFQRGICSYDASDKAPNFLSRLMSRFSFYGLFAGIGLIRSQSSLRVYPNGSNLKSGDIATGSFKHPVMKALAGSVIECMLNVRSEENCQAFKLWQGTEGGHKLIDMLILNIRNTTLAAKTLAALGEKRTLEDHYNLNINEESDYDVAILPWGADHMSQGLLASFEVAGFKKESSEKKGITYTSCKRLNRNLVLRLILSSEKKVKKDCR